MLHCIVVALNIHVDDIVVGVVAGIVIIHLSAITVIVHIGVYISLIMSYVQRSRPPVAGRIVAPIPG